MGRGNALVGRGIQARVLFSLLVMSVLAAAQPALPKQQQQPQRQRAVCSLKLQGYSDSKTLGVLDAQLHCTSSSPVTIGINTTYLGKFAAQFTGVEVVGDLACQQQAEGPLADLRARVPLFALLYFCGDYQLTLHRPLVHNISLVYYDDAWDTAVIALGGNVEGTVDGGHLADNNAGSALVALQTAVVTLQNWTTIGYNKGYAGAGIMATDSANLRLVDTVLRHNRATNGGSVALLRNSSVSMYNVNFINNSVEQYGGAVYASSLQHVTVMNTTWKNNTAGDYGGGLYMKNSVGEIINSTFTHGNTAISGGGVFCVGCKLQVASSAFVNNNAASYGGALSAIEEAQVTMLNTTWNNNKAGFGGGLYMENSIGKITHSTFTQETFAAWGSGVHCFGCQLQVATSAFVNNIAGFGGALGAEREAQVTVLNTTWNNNTAGISGGGLYMINSTGKIINSTFAQGNNATSGGGVYCFGCELQVAGSAFVNNSADAGGALYASKGAQVTVLNTTWNNNTAGRFGGGLYMINSTGKISNNTFAEGNNATSGGGVYCVGCKLQVASSAFVKNTADYGGALGAEGEAQVTVLNTTWNNNTAARSGGGLYMINSTGKIINSTFAQGNNATSGGGVYCFGCELQVAGSAFVHNSADAGGALYAKEEAQVTVLNTRWNNNTAGQAGGGFYIEDSVGEIINSAFAQENNAPLGGGVFCSGCQLQVASSAFVNNSADAGGALYASKGAQVTVLNTTWNNNTAGGSGGGIYMINSTGEIINSAFAQENNAILGGGVFCSGCQLQVANSAFVNNTAADFGGALCAGEGAQVTVFNTTWNNNTAGESGGGLYMLNSVGRIFNSAFTQGNNASSGGGVFCSGCKLQVTSSAFVNNNAANSGGAFHAMAAAQVTVLNTTWNHNTAGQAGGGLYIRDSVGKIINSAFAQGSATWGGGVLCTGCQLQVANSAFVNNNAAYDGGALCAGEEAQVTVLNTTWNHNTAGRAGGGFWTFHSIVIAFNSTWNNNTAGQFGGGLAMDAATDASLQACTVMWNTAGTGGGLDCRDETTCSLLDSLIAHNRGLYRGGGIMIATNASLSLLGNSYVTGNKVQSGTTGRYGGGVYLSSANFQHDQVVRATHNNSATFDADISSNLTHISVVGDSVIKDYVNRPGTDEGVLHVALNMSGYYGLPCEGLTAQALLADGAFLATSRSDTQGIAHLSFKVARPPGQYNIILSSLESPETEAANIILHVRNCVRGEVTPSRDSCQVCQQGYFSFDPSRGVCNTCPSNANCTGGDVILPLPGNWRSSANSTQMHRCPNPDACNITRLTSLQDCSADPACGASDTFKDLQCSPEYHGNLCGMCTVGNGATKLFVCRPCMKSSYVIALYVVAAVVMLVFIMLLCHLTRNQSRDALLGDEGKLPVAELLRPLVLYSQYMLIVSGMNIEWPASISYPMKILAWFWSSASPETLSIECLLPQNASLPASVQKVLFYLLVPVMLLLLVVLCEAIQLLVKHARSQMVAMELRDRLFSTILVALFFFLPSILRTLFSMFACVLIDQAAEAPYIPAAIGSFWVYDMNQQCFTGYHRAWAFGLGLPLALLFCLGIPIGMLLLLFLNKSRLKETAFIHHYCFLYKSYKDRFYYWESIVVCQTIILVAISVFGVNLGIYYQVIVMNAALIIIVGLLTVCRPYLYPQAGRVMLQAMSCLLLTCYVAQTFLDYGDVTASPVYRFVMGCVLLLANMTFIASVVWQMGKLVDWKKLTATAKKLVHKTIHKVCCCGSRTNGWWLPIRINLVPAIRRSAMGRVSVQLGSLKTNH